MTRTLRELAREDHPLFVGCDMHVRLDAAPAAHVVVLRHVHTQELREDLADGRPGILAFGVDGAAILDERQCFVRVDEAAGEL
jgi:hypothetical protein